MSERLLKILLGELATVRIVCRGKVRDGSPCGVTLETPLAGLHDLFAAGACRCQRCGTGFFLDTDGGLMVDPFRNLAKAIKDVLAVKDRAEVEFTLTDADGHEARSGVASRVDGR